MNRGSSSLNVLILSFCIIVNGLVVICLPMDAHEMSSGNAFQIWWEQNWMEDDPNVDPADEEIIFNYDDTNNQCYYLGDTNAEIRIHFYNRMGSAANNLYCRLYLGPGGASIITDIPDNREPAGSGVWAVIPDDADEWAIFTIDIATTGLVNTVYQNVLEITFTHDAGTSTFSFDLYISSIFDNDSSPTEIDIHDDLPNIEETDAHPDFEPGEVLQEGIIQLTNYADFSISDVEATLSSIPSGIDLTYDNDTALNPGPIIANGDLDLFWNFNVDTTTSPGHYSVDIEIMYNRSDTGAIIIEYARPSGLYVAPTTYVTGPEGGPTNIADIAITYFMTGTPPSVDLYFTTNTSTPYNWTLIDTISSPNGTYYWTVPADGSYGWVAVSDNETAPNSSHPPEASYYVYDGTPPEVESTTPTHGSINVGVDEDITITFNEPMKTTSLLYTIEPDPGGFSEVWTGGDRILTVSHSDFLSYTRYWMNITAVKDLAGNDLIILPHSFYFDSVYIPSTAEALGPISGPNNVAQITILYATTENPESVELYYTTNSGSPYTWTLIGEDSPADGSFEWTLPEDGQYGWYVVSPDETAPISSNAPQASYYYYDGTQPEVINAVPENLAVHVSLNTQMTITFSETMDTLSVENAFSYTDGQTIWGITQGTVSWNTIKDQMTFTPTFVLAYGTSYTVSITSGAMDSANNSLAATYSWSFTTQSAPDTTAPFVSSVTPVGNSTEIMNSITILFSESMNHTAVEDSITVSENIQIQSFDWVGTTLTITLNEDMEYNTQYTVTIGTGAKDLVGNSLSEPFTWSFITKEKDDEPTTDLSLFLVILVVVAIILILIIVIKKRKPNKSDINGELETKQDTSMEETTEEITNGQIEDK